MPGIQVIAGAVSLESVGLGGAPFAGAEIMLFTNSPSIGPQTVFADLTEPTFTGYARKATAWGAVGYNPTMQRAEGTMTAVAEFVGPADNTGQAVTGWGLIDTAGPDVLLAAGNFPAPVNLLVATDILDLVASVYGDGTADCQQV